MGNKRINDVKSRETMQFAKFLIENVLDETDENFGKLATQQWHCFGELKESTWRGYHSTLRFLKRRRHFCHSSVLPHWFSTLWDGECFDRGLQIPTIEEVDCKKYLHEIIDLCVEISTTTKHHAWFHYSGHVNAIDVHVQEGGWKKNIAGQPYVENIPTHILQIVCIDNEKQLKTAVKKLKEYARDKK